MKRLLAAVAALATLLGLTGCSGGLPFAAGTGKGGYQVKVVMSDVHNLVLNAEVKVADITVGSVTKMALKGWNAELTVRLNPDVSLPSDVQARVATKSLLGAQYLELKVPEATPGSQRSAMPTLGAGDTIPLAHTGAYPETEDLLIALSTLLNGGGLSQIRTITTELNRALDGRGDEVRQLLERLQRITTRLTQQRSQIVALLDELDALSATMAAEGTSMRKALPTLAPGLEALQAQIPQLNTTLRTVSQLNAVLTPVLAANQSDLVTEVRQLTPALKGLADAGDDIVPAMDMLPTLLYPTSKIETSVFGDYQNIYSEMDLTTATLLHNFAGVGPVPIPGQEPAGGLNPFAAVRGANGGDTPPPTLRQLLAPMNRGGTP